MPTSETIALPDSFIIQLSDTIFCGENIISHEDYILDYSNGNIVFNEIPPCDTLRITYSYLDIKIPLRLQNRVPTGSGGQLYRTPSPTKNLGMFPDGSRLVHSGSLLRGVKIGSRRDATIESAFQLEAYGEVGENIEITAVLSDQDLPIQPEGTSEKIAQLDQVFIDIASPHFGATFGDFTAKFTPEAQFTNYERRLSGVRMSGTSDLISGEAVGAVLEGVWETYEFNGIEGSQGPYPIRAGRKSSIQILAGTETVWLDGEKLRRGASNDYTIDYNLGQITFTNNRPIGAQTRIVVDFQYTDLDYRRSFYGVNGAISPHENIKFYFAGMTELDDPDNPINFDLTEQERLIIELAGDVAESAYVWGASISDSGNYALVDSGMETQHFEWVGGGSGGWDVFFSNVGPGKGDYSLSGGVYRWVGIGNGSYLPLKYLPLPAGQSIIDAGLVFTPTENIEISAEAAASNLDRNRLSTKGDNDNTGGALNIKLKSKHELMTGGKNYGNISIAGNYRRKEQRFAVIGRMDDAEYLRDWGLEGARGGEQLADVSLKYSPLQSLELSGGYGYNEVGETSSRRINSGIRLNTEKNKGSINFSRTSAVNTWDRLWGDFSGDYWVFMPALRWRYEDNSKPSGFRFYITEPSVSFKLNEGLIITPSYEYREDEIYSSLGETRQLSAITKAYKIKGEIAGWSLAFSRRDYNDKIGTSDLITDLASANGSFRILSPQISGRIRYELSRNQSEILEPYYLFVGEGLGNYEFDEDRGEYIPFPGGEYLKEYRSTGDFTPVIRSDFRANLSAKPGKIQGTKLASRILKQLSADGLVQAEGQTRAETGKSVILDPRDMNENPDLLTGNFVAEGNLRYGAGSRSLNIRRRFSKYRNTQYTTGEELRWGDSYALEGRISSLKWGNYRAKVEWSWRARLYPESSRIGNDLNGTELSLIWTRSISNAFQLTTDLSYLTQTDSWPVNDVTIRRYAIAPMGSYFLTKGAIRASIGYSRVESDVDAGILPYEMAHGDFIGDNGRANLDIDINVATATLLTLTYILEAHSGRFPEHTAKASVRVNF
jgi:hypothetical protein